MRSAKSSGSRNRTAALKAALFSFIFIFVAASASAVTITARNFQCFDTVNIADRYCSVDVTVGSSGIVDDGLIELGFNKKSIAPAAVAGWITQQQPCMQEFAYNTIFSYGIGPEGSISKTLIARSIPDGTYVPYLIHVTGCFNAGGAFKLPNPDIYIPKAEVVFGAAKANEKDQCNNPWEALQWVKAKGDLACTDAVCDNDASLTSTARCVTRGECGSGAEQWITCASGDSFAVRSCVGGLWQLSGRTCPGVKVIDPPYDCSIVPPPPQCTKGPDGGANWGKVLIAAGVVLLVVVGFRRFGRRFF